MSVFLLLLLLAVVLPLPTWVAIIRRLPNRWRIAAVNAATIAPLFIGSPPVVIGFCTLLWIALLAFSIFQNK